MPALVNGDIVAIPKDIINEARTLRILEIVGLIKVDPNAGLEVTVKEQMRPELGATAEYGNWEKIGQAHAAEGKM